MRVDPDKYACTTGVLLRLGATKRARTPTRVEPVAEVVDDWAAEVLPKWFQGNTNGSELVAPRKRAKTSTSVEPAAEVVDDWAAEVLPKWFQGSVNGSRRQWRLRNACSPAASTVEDNNIAHATQVTFPSAGTGAGSLSAGRRQTQTSPIVITSPDPQDKADPICTSPRRKRVSSGSNARSKQSTPKRRLSKAMKIFSNKGASPRRLSMCGFIVSPTRQQGDVDDSDVQILLSSASKKTKTKTLAPPTHVAPFPPALHCLGEIPCFFASEIAGLAGLHPYSTPLDVLVRCWRRHNLATFRSWERSTGGISLPECVFAKHASAKVHAAVREAVHAGDGAIPQEAEEKIREAVKASAPPDVQKAVFEEALGRAKRTRGTGLEATGLDAYELKYGRRVKRRNQDKFVKAFGAFKLSGRVDGFEEVSGERWVVEHKRRQRRLFRDVPRYEQVQCQAYMQMAGVKACRWVQTMGPEVSVRSLAICPLRWACIEGRLTAMAGLARRLFAGGHAPLAAELREMQAACWEAAPAWPECPMPSASRGRAAVCGDESDDSQLTENEQHVTMARSRPSGPPAQTGSELPSEIDVGGKGCGLVEVVEVVEVGGGGVADLQHSSAPQQVADDSQPVDRPAVCGSASGTPANAAGLFPNGTGQLHEETPAAQIHLPEPRATNENEPIRDRQLPAQVFCDGTKCDGNVFRSLEAQDISMTLKETSLTLKEASLTLLETRMSWKAMSTHKESVCSPKGVTGNSESQITATLQEEELTLPDSNLMNACPVSPAPSTVLDCSSDEEVATMTMTLLDNCQGFAQMAH